MRRSIVQQCSTSQIDHNAVMRQTAKWIGTVLCIVIAALFAFSLGHGVAWTSAGSQRSIDLGLGGIGIGWRPEGWRFEADPYASDPGWSIATWGWEVSLWDWQWTIECSRQRSWRGLTVPLWMLFVTVATPTTWLWWTGRRRTRLFLRGLLERIRPRRRKRLTIMLAVLFTAVHLVVCIGLDYLLSGLTGFYSWESMRATTWSWPWHHLENIIGWGAPAWGIVWAFLYVRLMNRWLMAGAGHHCLSCGYDLTGNTSGRCSECGTPCTLGADA